MDTAELTARTGVPIRKLRYVLDHRILPGLQGVGSGHGVPRTFTPFEGFAIALAARLLDAGVTRKLIAAVLGTVCRPTGSPQAPPDVPLFRAYTAATGSIEIGDGLYVRLRAPRRPGVGNALDTGWLPLESSEKVTGDYIPVVRVTVELGTFAQAVQGRRDDSEQT
jgi:hypothetical protein